jgi:hypothetical protein
MKECAPVPEALRYLCLERLHNFEVTARILLRGGISRFVPPVISVAYAWQKWHARNLGVNEPLDKL